MAEQSGSNYSESGDYYMSLECRRLKVKKHKCGTIEVFEISNLPLLDGEDVAAKYSGPAILKVYSTRQATLSLSDGTPPNDEQNSRSMLLRKAEREADALFVLNKMGCEHVPNLLSHWVESIKDSESDDSTSSRTPKYTGDCSLKHYILMAKVPGITLQSGWKYLSVNEQCRVEDAFARAVQAVHKCGVDNGSAHYGNIIWSLEETKCYIIDFERATYKRHKFLSTDPEVWGLY